LMQTRRIPTFAAAAFVTSSAFSNTTVAFLCPSSQRAIKSFHVPPWQRSYSVSKCSALKDSIGTDYNEFPNNQSDNGKWTDILPLRKGSHNSVNITVPAATKENHRMFENVSFREHLIATIDACRNMRKSSIWIEVPMSRCSLIEGGDMYQLGFRFHHALDDKAVLNLWLPENSESKVPAFSTHHVGVGAMVVNSRNEILCVRELRKNYMPWKTPTGLSDLGEPIEAAAEREVLEETGIRTTFHSIIGFRQSHGVAHGRSDLFFVCRLDPIEDVDENGKRVIPEPVAQQCEIEIAQWVPLAEYRAMVNGGNGERGHPMMSHMLKVLESGSYLERKVVENVIPGREGHSIFYPREA